MDLNFQKNFSLRSYNTFGINVQSKQFIGVKNTEELQYVLRHKKNENTHVFNKSIIFKNVENKNRNHTCYGTHFKFLTIFNIYIYIYISTPYYDIKSYIYKCISYKCIFKNSLRRKMYFVI